MGITIRTHRRNLSYDDAVTLDELWVIAKQFDWSLYCESPEEYVRRMETCREILAVLALCTEKQRERFLLHALYDLSHAEVAKLRGCSKEAVRLSIEAVRKKFMKFFRYPPCRSAFPNGYKVRGNTLHYREGQAAVSAWPLCHLKEVTMAIINLKRYYPHYSKLVCSPSSGQRNKLPKIHSHAVLWHLAKFVCLALVSKQILQGLFMLP